MIIKQVRFLLSVVMILSLTACFDKAGNDDTPPANSEPIEGNPNNSGNDDPNTNKDPVTSTDPGANTDPNQNTDPDPVVVTPPSTVVPKPNLPTFTVQGYDISFEYGELETGYSYQIYFSENDFTQTAGAVSIVTTPVLTDQNKSSLENYIRAATLKSKGLDLTTSKTVYIRMLARDSDGHVSELSEPVQLYYLARPDVSSVSSSGNEITVEWSTEIDTVYNIYYRSAIIGKIDQATLVSGGPFTSGKETFSSPDCKNKYVCSIAIVAVKGNSVSDPVFVNSFTITPNTPLAPDLSSLGTTVTVSYSENTLALPYSHQVYISTENFTDPADAFLLGSISRNRNSANQTWELPAAMKLDLSQDHTLYVGTVALDPTQSSNTSSLSEVKQIKYLASPTDVANITADYRDLTIEWPVVAGKTYKVYINTSDTFAFRGSVSVSEVPLADGVVKTKCPSLVCSIGITTVDGDSESAPLVVAGFKINSQTPDRTINKTTKTGEQYITQFTKTADGYSVNYSTTSPVSKDDALVYDSETDGNQTSVIHNIPAYYDANGDALTYYYGVRSYVNNEFTNPGGETKTFKAYSLFRQVDTYTPVIDDFKLYDTYKSQVEIVDGVLYSTVRSGNSAAILNRDPLDGGSSSSDTLSTDYKRFAIEPTATDTVYYITARPYFSSPVIPSLYKKTAGVLKGRVDLVSVIYDDFVDFVQSATHLYLLTKTKVLKIAKSSVVNSGSFEEMLVLADSVADSSSPTDLEISADGSTLYIASPLGVLSIPTTGTFPVSSAEVLTDLPVDYLAVSGSDLYFVDSALIASINRIDLTTGDVTEVKKYVSSTDFLSIFGDWLYFSSGHSTYRLSVVDNTLERIAKLNASNVAVDTSPSGEGIYLAGQATGSQGVYHFPESFYTAPPAIPVVGEITTTPGDMSVLVNITDAGDAEAFEMNGVASSPNAKITGLTNGTPVDITVKAYNISGVSSSVTVTETPVVVTPQIIDQAGGNQSRNIKAGNVSGELSFYVSWRNISARNLILNIYRSTTPDVDISGTPVDSVPLYVPDTFYYEHLYTATGLVDGQFYYFRVVLTEADDSGASLPSNVVGAMPYEPYVDAGAGAPKDGNIVVYDSRIIWTTGNPDLGIKAAKDRFVEPVYRIDGFAAFLVAPNTTQLVSGDFAIYGVGSDKRVVEITRDFSYSGSVMWKERELGFTENVIEQLALDGAQLYMAGGGNISSFDVLTGLESPLYNTLNSIEHLSEAGGYLYWLESGTEIMRISKVGGTAETVLSLTESAPVKYFDVVDLGDLTTPDVKIIYSLEKYPSFTVMQYSVSDQSSIILTEKSLYASFALSGTGEVYLAVQKISSSNLSFKEFVKIDALGVETTVRKGVPVSNLINLGLEPAKLFLDGSSLYFVLPQERIYQVN